MKPKLYYYVFKENLHSSDEDCSDCDCACPDSNLTLIQRIHLDKENFLKGRILVCNTNLNDQIKINSTHYAFLSSQSQTPLVVLNQAALEIMDFFSQPRNPTKWTHTAAIKYEDAQIAIAELYELGLLKDVSPIGQSSLSPKIKPTLEVWLYLTRACNLSCAHCFVNKDSRRMSLETGLEAVERLFHLAQKHGHPAVKIKYAGGEPTMNWELIPALHRRAIQLAREMGLHLIETLITNATLLTSERLQFIKEEKIRLSISLDGFGAGHDAQRTVKNGDPSFERVLDAVLLACKMGLSPYLTMTLTSLNLHEAPQVVRFALENHLLMNLNFYRPHASGDPIVADNQLLEEALRKSLKVVEENLPDYNFLEGLIDRSYFGASHEHACGAGRNYFAIDADGSVSPCHMLTGYDLSGKPLKFFESMHFEGFINPNVNQRNDCQTCEWRYWCAGGCPVHTMNIVGIVTASSPYCGVYKAIFPELVRLRALQLLSLTKEPV